MKKLRKYHNNDTDTYLNIPNDTYLNIRRKCKNKFRACLKDKMKNHLEAKFLDRYKFASPHSPRARSFYKHRLECSWTSKYVSFSYNNCW